jgi:uncharacterized membrane protein HdeD (DUF308 family)
MPADDRLEGEMTETPETPGAPETPTGPTGGEPPAPPPPPPAPPAPPAPASAAGYPLQADIIRQEEYSRFMPLIKWLLAIPHYIVLFFLPIAAFVVILISFFAVLITGRYPRGMFDFVVGVFRWLWRVFAYTHLMVDPYPPFTLDDDPGYPARFSIEYPERIDRWRPLVQWLLIIPYGLIAGILLYLAELMVFFAFFTILFTKKFPEGIFRLALIPLRWAARANAYRDWLVTRYPPFVWD